MTTASSSTAPGGASRWSACREFLLVVAALAGCDELFRLDRLPEVPPPDASMPGTWAQVTAGDAHICGIRLDDTLPTRVNTDAWTAVALGGTHTCGITTQGAKCWGSNGTGQLGDGTQTSTASPVSIGMTMALELGDYFTCGLANTDLRCWGYNLYGQLGDGTTTMRLMSVRVAGAYSAFSTGANHACAVATDGTLHCWGNNGSGQLGSAMTSTMLPTPVGTETTWLSVSAGSKHTCATRTDRSLWCWGDNAYGQVGIGAAVAEAVPLLVP